MIRNYAGWAIYTSTANPVTGRWVAFRYGVRVCARTESELIELLNRRTS